MAIITLTTDWRNSDYYIGAVKGKIVSQESSTTIVDISHQIAPFNTMQAAFVLKNCYKEFPEQTIHIVGVNTVLSKEKGVLIVEKDNRFFLCSDSGFPDLIFPNEEKKVYRLKIDEKVANTFASLDVFVGAAFQILSGKPPEEFAQVCTDYIKQMPFIPTIDSNLINGSVVFVDSYSNAITNITKEIFEHVGKNRPFEIFVQSNHYKVSKIVNSYLDVSVGELVALFNSGDLLEIAIVNGPAAELLNLSINSTIRIKFSNQRDINQLLLSGE